MFGTLRYVSQSDDPEFIERSHGGQLNAIGGRGPQHSACDKCRSKKVEYQRFQDKCASSLGWKADQ